MLWISSAPTASLDFQLQCMKGALLNKMHAAWADFGKVVKTLEVYTSPREVCVTAAYAVRKLQIPCTTMKCQAEAEDTYRGQGIAVGKFREHVFFLLGSSVYPSEERPVGFLNPFWIMGQSSDQEECNMEIYPLDGKATLSLDGEIRLPVARNSKKLEPGETLVLFKPEVPSKSCGEVLQAVKKQRV